MDKVCINCKWVHRNGFCDNDKEPDLECRRRAPHPYPDNNDMPNYPKVYHDLWCGEWEGKIGKKSLDELEKDVMKAMKNITDYFVNQSLDK